MYGGYRIDHLKNCVKMRPIMFMRKLLLLLLIVAFPLQAFAEVNTAFEWKHETETRVAKRHLNICFHRGMNSQWREWATAGMNLWNAQADTTGWSFEIVPFTKSRCDVFLMLSDIEERIYGGVLVEWVDTVKGETELVDGRANAAVVTIDSHLEDTVGWLKKKEDIKDGYRDGWSTDEAEGTMDPIDVVAHALSRVMRLDSVSQRQEKLLSSNVKDMPLPGQHLHALSLADIRAASEANKAPFAIESMVLNNTTQQTVTLGELTFDVPRNAFDSRVRSNTLFMTEVPQSLAPVPFSVPLGHSHVVRVMGIYTSAPLAQSVQVSTSYDPEILSASASPILGTSGFYAPGLGEYSLTVMKLERETWDLTPVDVEPNPSKWVELETVTVEREEKNIRFTIDEPGYYALVAKPDPAKPAIESVYSRVYGDKIVPSNRIAFMRAQEALRVLMDDRLAIYAFGIFSGLALFLLYTYVSTKKRAKREKEQASKKPQII